MPLAALEAGLPWDWASFGDWLSRLDGGIGINAGFLCGHSALRRVAMGEDAVGGRGVGGPGRGHGRRPCTTRWPPAPWGSRRRPRRPTTTARSQPVPSRAADRDELLALAGVGARPPGDDAGGDPGRLPQRLHRRRGRSHVGDVARRQPPDQLERARRQLAQPRRALAAARRVRPGQRRVARGWWPSPCRTRWACG